MKDGIPAWSVVIVVPRGENTVLALSRGFNPRDPALPGGDSESTDESPAATAHRELLEETGIVANELRCVDQWEGERGQPVFAFVAPKWKGKLRVSTEGKPFWTHPKTLLVNRATFHQQTQKLFDKLGDLVLAGEPDAS